MPLLGQLGISGGAAADSAVYGCPWPGWRRLRRMHSFRRFESSFEQLPSLNPGRTSGIAIFLKQTTQDQSKNKRTSCFHPVVPTGKRRRGCSVQAAYRPLIDDSRFLVEGRRTTLLCSVQHVAFFRTRFITQSCSGLIDVMEKHFNQAVSVRLSLLYPFLAAWAVFSRVQTMVWLPVFGIFTDRMMWKIMDRMHTGHGRED